MNLAKTSKVFLIAIFGMHLLQSQSVFINEFMVSNSLTIADEFGEFDDWVEIYNAGLVSFNVGGKFVTDDLTNPTKWQIPNTSPDLTTIPPGGYLLLWFDGSPDQGVLHADPKLGSSGEQIGIFDTDGFTPLDTLTYGPQATDISLGRSPDGGPNFVAFSTPTPGSANGIASLGATKAPIASLGGGFYTTPLQLAFSQSENALIHYTTDGSDPTENDLLYTSPISLNSTQVVRAKAFKAGYDPSEITTNTYFFNINPTFPIVAFSGNPEKFFGEENGLFPNFLEDIEVPINVEFYEPNGSQGFNQVAEVELHGSTSVTLPQKSLAIKAKGSLGKATIDYPVFPDEPLSQYRSLILRNSGQDWEYTLFRDAMQSSLTRDLSDLEVKIEKPNLDGQAFRPAIAYINGEYWGIYNIRERLDWRYLKVHYGLEDAEVDLLENLDDIKEGDFQEWNRLDSLLRAKSYDTEAGLNELKALADLDNYMDYIIFNIFIDNTDWPGNNYRRWRQRTPLGKWRWMVKDLDFGFGFLELNTSNFNTGNFNVNSLNRMLQPTFSYPNPEWATLLFNKLMENPTWKRDFINRMADQLNVLYPTERMLQRIGEFQMRYQPEINQHNQKWENVWTWNQDVDVLRTFAGGRVQAVRNHFIESIPEITGTSEVSLTATPLHGGKIKINTVTIEQNNYPWTGTYFNGIDIPIEAIPNPGFIFAGWSATIPTTSAITTINLNGNTSISAIFIPDDGTNQPLEQTIDFPPIPDKLVSDLPFAISATASSGLPVTLSIISGPASLVGNSITLNGVPGIITVRASQSGNEQFNPAPDVEQSFQVLDHTPPSGNYCDASGEQPWEEYIAQVSFAAINNLSGKNQYGNFTNQTATVKKGESYPITLTPGFSWAHYDEVFSVWIDWNQDKDFEDLDEKVFTGNFLIGIHGTPANPISGTINIPQNALVGMTRMRVAMQRNQAPEPCGTFILGETEDYSISITEQSVFSLELNCPEAVSLNASPENTGVLVNWDPPSASTNCPEGISSVTQTGGLPNGSFFPIGSALIEYTATDNCGNTTTCNFEVKIIPSSSHCSSKGNQPWQEYIAQVTLNTLNNPSFKEQYGDFSNLSTTLQRGEDYQISLTPGFSYFQWDESFQVWIDFDGNGSFDDNKELVFSGIYPAQASGSPPVPINGTISIPNSIQPISTKMRVSMQRNTPATSCEIFEFGEVEDYSIQIDQATAGPRASSYLNFTAFHSGRAIELQWLTNAKSKHFTIERSANGTDFEPLKNIHPPSNKNTHSFFKELDAYPLMGNNYYRLEQVLMDGSSILSPVQWVPFQINLNEVAVFPNPAKEVLYLQLKELSGQSGTIQLFDTYGRLHWELNFKNFPKAPFSLPLHALPDGLYYLKIQTKAGKAVNKKVVVSRY